MRKAGARTHVQKELLKQRVVIYLHYSIYNPVVMWISEEQTDFGFSIS